MTVCDADYEQEEAVVCLTGAVAEKLAVRLMFEVLRGEFYAEKATGLRGRSNRVTLVYYYYYD